MESSIISNLFTATHKVLKIQKAQHEIRTKQNFFHNIIYPFKQPIKKVKICTFVHNINIKMLPKLLHKKTLFQQSTIHTAYKTTKEKKN